MKYDFSGYATKNDLRCSDGRTILRDAFKEQDGMTVPLVWQHFHSTPDNILGHAVLENRPDGVYARGSFNDTEQGQMAKALVDHKDIRFLSIFANQLVQKGNNVHHGSIKEVSLVLAGANPGAHIDNLSIEHSDGTPSEEDLTEAVIYNNNEVFLEEEIEHADSTPPAEGGKTMEEIFNTLTEEQQNVVYEMLAYTVEEAANLQHSEEPPPAEAPPTQEEPPATIEHSNEEPIGGEDTMKRNIFDKTANPNAKNTLSHDELQHFMTDVRAFGSMKGFVLAHADELPTTYGIENIDILFPDAKTLTPTPEMISRDMTWVPGVISGTRHTPFSRIKSVAADITADEARARGYIKGTEKKEEVIKLLKRFTTPTTIYKKQKLDRDDIIDIVDLDVVAFLKMEMRVMLDEEIARAVLISDGRAIDEEGKINEENIRPIYKDADLYAHHVSIAKAHTTEDIIDDIILARKEYKGSGNPTFYTSTEVLTDMLLLKDGLKRRMYRSVDELAKELRVANIVEVTPMSNLSRPGGTVLAPVTMNLIGIIVNLSDYSLGADKGGQISMFDDFDIDFNQYKYLIETRCSGALTKCKSALVLEQIGADIIPG